MNSEGNSQNSPFILGLGVPVAGLTVFSCDLEPAANEHKYGCHNEVMSAEKTLLKSYPVSLFLVFLFFSVSAPALQIHADISIYLISILTKYTPI